MNQTSNQLELLFKNADGKNAKIALKHAKAGLERPAVEGVMSTLRDSNLFAKDGADMHATIVGARYVSRQVSDIFKVEEAAE